MSQRIILDVMAKEIRELREWKQRAQKVVEEHSKSMEAMAIQAQDLRSKIALLAAENARLKAAR